MKLPSTNSKLRRALDPGPLDASSHRDEIARLKQLFGHAIEIDGLQPLETCVPYALKLTDDPAYEAIRHAHQDIYAGPEFMEWMIGNLLVELAAATLGCLICYFSNGHFKHVGIMLSADRVRSKWGVMPRYVHSIDEVPAAYGYCVRFFHCPTPTVAKAKFREFALRKGLTQSAIEQLVTAR